MTEPARDHLAPGEMPPEVRARVVEILAAALVGSTRRHPERYGLAQNTAPARHEDKAQ